MREVMAVAVGIKAIRASYNIKASANFKTLVHCQNNKRLSNLATLLEVLKLLSRTDTICFASEIESVQSPTLVQNALEGLDITICADVKGLVDASAERAKNEAKAKKVRLELDILKARRERASAEADERDRLKMVQLSENLDALSRQAEILKQCQS